MFRDIRRPRDSPRLKVHDRILTNNRLYFPLNVISRIERISSSRLKAGKERDPSHCSNMYKFASRQGKKKETKRRRNRSARANDRWTGRRSPVSDTYIQTIQIILRDVGGDAHVTTSSTNHLYIVYNFILKRKLSLFRDDSSVARGPNSDREARTIRQLVVVRGIKKRAALSLYDNTI